MIEKWKKGLSRIFSKYSSLLWLIEVFLLVGILYFGIKGSMILALRNSTPMMGVKSGSMEPTLHRGDLIIIRGYDDVSQVKENDIIVFDISGSPKVTPRVHRIYEVLGSQSGFITKGDAYSKPDDWIVKWEYIRGKVIAHIPYLGYPSILV